MLKLEFKQKSVDRFLKDVDKLFLEIHKNVGNHRSYKQLEAKVKGGLFANREMLFENDIQYAELKYKLKQRGLIKHSTPLAVTGQLINDFSIRLMEHSPDEIQQGLGFDGFNRSRPTISSMMSAGKDENEALEYRDVDSAYVAATLEAKGYRIGESIEKAYGKTIALEVAKLIDKAFRKIR